MLLDRRAEVDPPKIRQDRELDTNTKLVIGRTCSKDSFEADDVPIEALPFKVS